MVGRLKQSTMAKPEALGMLGRVSPPNVSDPAHARSDSQTTSPLSHSPSPCRLTFVSNPWAESAATCVLGYPSSHWPGSVVLVAGAVWPMGGLASAIPLCSFSSSGGWGRERAGGVGGGGRGELVFHIKSQAPPTQPEANRKDGRGRTPFAPATSLSRTTKTPSMPLIMWLAASSCSSCRASKTIARTTRAPTRRATTSTRQRATATAAAAATTPAAKQQQQPRELLQGPRRASPNSPGRA